MNASLVLQDRQTDTYWSIMKGVAVAGALAGEQLRELPVGEKMQWRHWRAKHPDTLVLSVNGRQDALDSYRSYFRDENGFRGQRASDERLRTKTPIFAFHSGGAAYAVAHDAIANGRSFRLGDDVFVFLYRRKGSSMFRSTRAFVSSEPFERDGEHWRDRSGARFDAESGSFGPVSVLGGFDTFWYNFSLNNPETTLLE